jgi:hypothetical protein
LIAPSIPEVSLELAGLVALADLTVLSKRTALTGKATLLDTFLICPGMHRQQHATELNEGEFPAVANMTSGYVFRVENPGTVFYLQQMGRTGQLTTLSVKRADMKVGSFVSMIYPTEISNLISVIAYGLAILLSLAIIILMVLSQDWWGVFVVLILAVSRLINILIIQRRFKLGWRGAEEPETHGDLIILMSQDRWLRIRGLVDDLKAVTSGQWLRDLNRLESAVVGFATLLVYLDAALASNMKQFGKIMLIVLLIGTAGLLDIANAATDKLLMHERIIEMDEPRKEYGRRLLLARELITESGRSNWALKMGMVNDDDLDEHQETPDNSEGHNGKVGEGLGSTTEQRADKASTQTVNREIGSESSNAKPSSPFMGRVTM